MSSEGLTSCPTNYRRGPQRTTEDRRGPQGTAKDPQRTTEDHRAESQIKKIRIGGKYPYKYFKEKNHLQFIYITDYINQYNICDLYYIQCVWDKS